MTSEEYGKDIARRLAAGMAVSRAIPAGTPGTNTLMSDDDMRKFVDVLSPMVGRKLRLRGDDDDGTAGVLVPA